MGEICITLLLSSPSQSCRLPEERCYVLDGGRQSGQFTLQWLVHLSSGLPVLLVSARLGHFFPPLSPIRPSRSTLTSRAAVLVAHLSGTRIVPRYASLIPLSFLFYSSGVL